MKFSTNALFAFAVASFASNAAVFATEAPLEEGHFIGVLELTKAGEATPMSDEERNALNDLVQDKYNNELDSATIDHITSVELLSTTMTTEEDARRNLARNLSSIHSTITYEFVITSEQCTFCHQECELDTESLACVKYLTEQEGEEERRRRKLTNYYSWSQYGSSVCGGVNSGTTSGYSCSWSSTYYNKPPKTMM